MNCTTAYIGLGSNLGNRRQFINDALRMLSQTPDVKLVAATEPTETSPLGGTGQPGYLNAVAELKTGLSAEKLHKRLVEIEDALGRKREKKWVPRTIDLDLLLFGSEIINTDTLIVPHPQMHLRSFVLNELCKLNPKLLHPVLGETMKILSARLNDSDFAPYTDGPKLISIAGNIGAGKTTLAKKLSAILSCRLILEAYDTNPFLSKVYAGNRNLALDSQLYFLLSRIEQLDPNIPGTNRPAVADYVFYKELIYAEALLSAEQLGLYHKIYSRLSAAIVQPSLLVYLRNSSVRCLERIERRNRPYERQIRIDFLETVGAGYEKLLADWKLCPAITLTDFDCLDKNAVEQLGEKIKYYINPAGTGKAERQKTI